MVPKSKRKNSKDITKKLSRTESLPSSPIQQPSYIPAELQQTLLNIFQNAFPISSPSDLKSVIQEVKGRLYDRDFAAAFGKGEYLEAYALRWSPPRALAYAEILMQHDLLGELQDTRDGDSPPKVVCVGGGAGAEVVALAGVLRQSELKRLQSQGDEDGGDDDLDSSKSVTVVAVDIADWSSIVNRLRDTITRRPPISKYASDTARAANRPLLYRGMLNVELIKSDVLELNYHGMLQTFEGATMITLMFTLNELFSSDMTKTTQFLLQLADVTEPGVLLLVVDSPGSYSTVAVGNSGKEPKKYPMKWLLEHALLTTAKGKWDRAMSDDAEWFRMNEDLKYPLDLEDMRYQIHMYKRT